MLKPFAYAVLLATALPSLPLLAQHRPQEAHEQRENRFELRGQVTDINGEPLVGATVRLMNTDLVAITGKGGFYHLTRLPKGEHTISVFRIGYEHIEKAVRFGKGSDEHRHLDFVLAERQSDLPQVEVTGRRERSYKNSVSFIGTKTATLLKDVPQSVGYVTKELTLDQGAYSVNDVVKNISGVNPYTFYNDFSIRGFRTTGNRNSGNLLNGMRAQTSLWRQSSLATIERVEVIKGPSSALFGNASPGGVINRVTKKPLDYQRNSVSATVGSFNTLRTFGDFTGPPTVPNSPPRRKPLFPVSVLFTPLPPTSISTPHGLKATSRRTLPFRAILKRVLLSTRSPVVFGKLEQKANGSTSA